MAVFLDGSRQRGWDGIGNHSPRSDAAMSGTRVLDMSSRSVIEKSKGKTRMPRLT